MYMSGKKNHDIADAMGIAEETVRVHKLRAIVITVFDSLISFAIVKDSHCRIEIHRFFTHFCCILLLGVAYLLQTFKKTR